MERENRDNTLNRIQFYFNKLNGMDILYVIGVIIFFFAICVFVLSCFTDLRLFMLGGTPDCFFERLTGIYCPGCGMTRATFALFDGKIIKSLLYNAVIPYGTVCYLFLMLKQTLHYIYGKRAVTERLILNLLYIGVALAIVQWIVKVVLLLVFRIKVL